MWCAETQPILPLSTVSDVAFVGFCMLRELRNWPQAAFLVLRKFLSKHQSSLYLVLANISDISAQIYVVPINLVPMHLVPNPELVCATSKKSAAKAARGCLVGKKLFLLPFWRFVPSSGTSCKKSRALLNLFGTCAGSIHIVSSIAPWFLLVSLLLNVEKRGTNALSYSSSSSSSSSSSWLKKNKKCQDRYGVVQWVEKYSELFRFMWIQQIYIYISTN